VSSQVNGKELAVEVTGDGPAVLLVHGLGGTSNFYQPQVPPCPSGHRDERGEAEDRQAHAHDELVDAARSRDPERVRAAYVSTSRTI
jgi:pimeloyl-ACP methyl ester carboxylesterase